MLHRATSIYNSQRPLPISERCWCQQGGHWLVKGDKTTREWAKTLRDTKYKGVSDAEFEALWKRTTLTEFYQKKEAFLAQEKIDLAAAEEKEKQQKLDYEARMAADGEAVEAE